MPSTNSDPRRPTSPWVYVAWGCGGCLVLAVVVWVAVTLALGVLVRSMLSTSPPKRTGPYTYDHTSTCAKCVVQIPDGSGTLTYMHVLGDGSGKVYAEGERALRVRTKTLGMVDCPLQYYCRPGVRVGLYWYHRANGSGPFLRLLDDGGDTIIDLDRGVTRLAQRFGSRMYAGDFRDPHNYEHFGYETTYDAAGKPSSPSNITFDGKPADDVTATFGKRKGVYIGSIVRSGNALTLVRAAPARPAAR